MSKAKYILSIILGICIYPLTKAQNDTVYVYEDIIVYDTLVVYDTVFIAPEINNTAPLKRKSINLLQLDTINHQANLLLISDNQTATFPINRIILNKNIKNLKNMKKLSFFSIVFFAFQTMVLAQTNYEISVGSGVWWETSDNEHLNTPYSALLNTGVFAKRNLTGRNIGIKTGIEYSYLLGSNNYEIDDTMGIWHSENSSELEAINSNYGAGQHNISIPILIYFDKYKIQPFCGFNYNYLITNTQTSPTGTKFFSDSHNIGLNFGICFNINNLFSVNMACKHNLTSDFNQNKLNESNDIGNTPLDNSHKFKNTQIKLSLVYSFSKRKK